MTNCVCVWEGGSNRFGYVLRVLRCGLLTAVCCPTAGTDTHNRHPESRESRLSNTSSTGIGELLLWLPIWRYDDMTIWRYDDTIHFHMIYHPRIPTPEWYDWHNQPMRSHCLSDCLSPIPYLLSPFPFLHPRRHSSVGCRCGRDPLLLFHRTPSLVIHREWGCQSARRSSVALPRSSEYRISNITIRTKNQNHKVLTIWRPGILLSSVMISVMKSYVVEWTPWSHYHHIIHMIWSKTNQLETCRGLWGLGISVALSASSLLFHL